MAFPASPTAHATVTGVNGGTTGGVDTTGATLLVAVIGYYNGLGASPVPTDSKSNTWVQIGTTQVGSNTSVKMFYVASPTVGTGHTFSSTSSGSNGYSSAEFGAWSGSAASPLDQTSQAAAKQAGSVTPTEDNELLVAGICCEDLASVTAIDSGFTISDSNAYGSGNNESSALAYLVETTAAAKNPLWTAGGNAGSTATIIATFKAAAGAGTQNLSPSLFTNSNTFFAPTVVAGAVNLTPSLFTNTNTFFAPTVATAGNLAPSLFTNTSTFFSPTVGRGVVNLAPTLFTNSNIFYSPTVAVAQPQTILPSLFTNQSTFFLPVVRSHIVLVNVYVKLLAPHVFDAIEWPTDTIFGPDQSRIPSDFQYTPLMEGLSGDSTTAIAQTKIDVFGRYDSHGNLLDNPPIPRPIYDPQPTPPVGNKHILPLGNTC